MKGGLESGLQIRAEKGEKLFLSSSIIFKGVQELVNQQGRLYSPVSSDPAVLELLCPLMCQSFPPLTEGPAQHHCWFLLPTQSWLWYFQQEKLFPLTRPL